MKKNTTTLTTFTCESCGKSWNKESEVRTCTLCGIKDTCRSCHYISILDSRYVRDVAQNVISGVWESLAYSNRSKILDYVCIECRDRLENHIATLNSRSIKSILELISEIQKEKESHAGA